MKTPARYTAMILLAVGIFLAGYLANRQKDPSTSLASAGLQSKFICPMHPQYSSDRSGTCPICGMSLVASSSEAAAGGSEMDASAVPGTVQISAEKQQLTGIRIDTVRQTSASHLMRIPGRIAVDETRLYRIVAAADGWILRMGENTAGTAVRRNQILASYYAPSMVVTQQNFLYALGRNDQVQKTDVVLSLQRSSLPLNLESAVDTIRGLGMDDVQIREIQRTRKYASEIQIHSPVSGYVISRSVSPGQRFDKGAELYAIADIDHVWVMTDIFEKDRELLTPHTKATIHYQGREFQARMSDALPQFDPQSRILKTRFELDNPNSVLLPDMFVDVEIPVERPASITVPADAVINSGRRKTVYVEREPGMFEPRLVETGWRLGSRVQIVHGLEPGERIVVSGNFLVDSESRMKMPDSSRSAQSEQSKLVKDPVCGMDVDPKSPDTVKSQYKGKTYYFCGAMCKKNFDANPEKYIKKTTAPKADKAKDLVCGMDVDIKQDTPKSQYKGKTYYFCSKFCKKSFDADPEAYVGKGMAPHDMYGTEMMP